ncbi:DUF1707 SHOCT-like domain-containing protein [Mycobacterium sp. HUMS_1102779]|uniref:DUF1707 SHOCT-like domain-containing protein n=1 Tax=Mycobacterium sp. HUMS_1102779 TaxID=3383487 RepID=UPI00389AEF26
MAKWLGTPLGGGARTRAKDSDRQDICKVLDNALADGELSMEEHRQRVSAATNAVTLGDLRELVTDLQADNTAAAPPAVKPPSIPGRWGILAGAFVASVLLGVGIGWGLYGNTGSPLDFTKDPGAKPDGVAAVVLTPPRQLQSLGGLTGLLEQTRKRFGDTLGFRLVVYPEYAVLDRRDPGNDRRVLGYTYRGGWGDPNSNAKSSTDATLVDLSKFDVKTTVGILRGAPETLGIKPADVKSTYLIVEPGEAPTTPGALSLSVYVSSDYGGGYITLAADGTVKRVNYPSS